MSPTATRTRTAAGGASAQRPDLRRELDRRRSAPRRLVLAGVAGAALLLVAVLVWLVVASSVLETREVAVTGQRRLSEAQVRDAAAVPLGVPLARLDLDAVARRTTTLPQVASATVERGWPHTLKIAVVEREPLLAIREPDGFALVDPRGVVFDQASKLPPGVLLTAADPTAVPLLTDLGVVATALPPDLRKRVERVRASAADDIVIDLESGATIRWGNASESPLKAQIVEALLTDDTRSIDVSAPHTPATR